MTRASPSSIVAKNCVCVCVCSLADCGESNVRRYGNSYLQVCEKGLGRAARGKLCLMTLMRRRSRSQEVACSVMREVLGGS